MFKFLLIAGVVYFFFRMNNQKSIQHPQDPKSQNNNKEPLEYTDYEEVE